MWFGEDDAHGAVGETVEAADRTGQLRSILDAVRSHRVEDDSPLHVRVGVPLRDGAHGDAEALREALVGEAQRSLQGVRSLPGPDVDYPAAFAAGAARLCSRGVTELGVDDFAVGSPSPVVSTAQSAGALGGSVVACCWSHFW